MTSSTATDLPRLVLFTSGLLIFFFIPLAALLVMVLLALTLENGKGFHWLVAAGVVLFLAFLNSTKQVEGDLILYLQFYEQSQQMDLFSYLGKNVSDSLFFVLVFFHANLFADFHSFIFLTTLIAYGTYWWGVSTFGRLCRQPMGLIAASFFIFCFLNETFSLSAHLVRQFLAGAFVVAALVSDRRGNRWLLYFVALLTHFSSFVFLPFMFTGASHWNYGRATRIALISCGAFFVISSVLFTFLGRLETGIPYLGAVLGRFAGGGAENNGSIGPFGFALIAINLVVLFVYREHAAPERRFLLASMVLSLLVISLVPYPLFHLRYFVYVYFFIPMTILIAPPLPVVGRLGYLFLAPALLLRFSTLVTSSVWHYQFTGNLFFASFILGEQN